jgi:hypothetical protein
LKLRFALHPELDESPEVFGGAPGITTSLIDEASSIVSGRQVDQIVEGVILE